MASVPFKFTTAASTNLQPVRAGQAGNLNGIIVANVATAIFIKFYWFTPTAASAGPTVGTTVPNVTFGVSASANVSQFFNPPMTGNGQLWVAVTAAAIDSDVGAAAAGAVVTLLVE